MQFYYGNQNVLRALDEAEFWKHQEAEHTGLIPVVAPELEAEYVKELEQFGLTFNAQQAEAVKFIQSVNRSRGTVDRNLNRQMLDFLHACMTESQAFCDLLQEMLKNSSAIKANAPAQTVLQHMVRESQYFIGIDQLILQ